MGFREIKNTARRHLHDHMKVPAVYYRTPTATPVLIHVRPHSKREKVGDQSGTSLSYAEVQEVVPSVIFDRAEIDKPVRNALVVISREEGYYVDNVLQPDGVTVTAEVAYATEKDLTGKVLPSELV